MRVAVVMPRGSQMERDRSNSIETVAALVNAPGQQRGETRIICDAGAIDPALPGLVTVPAGLSKSARRRAITALVRDFDPNIVEYHQQLGMAAALAKGMPGPIHMLYRHTRIRAPRNLFERFRYRARLQAFDHLLFVSDAACAEFRSDYPGFDRSISALANPIDVSRWRGDPGDRDPLILFVGRAMPEKGLDAFCLALATVLDRHPDWRGALMLGDWDRHQAWATPHLCALDRFGGRVEVYRSASSAKVMEVTRRAAIAVTPSRIPEALGLTALEAHVGGAALVSSGRGGLSEASGDHALYVDPPEPGGLVEAIVSLIENPQRRLSMAEAGQARAVAVSDPDLAAALLADLRESLLCRRSFVGARMASG